MKTIGTLLLFTLILSGFPALAKVYDSDGSEASVRALHNAAHDGDTITLPAGTFSWTSPLKITKGLTLKGQTTITGPASNPTITDATIIQDSTPRSSNIIKATMTPTQSFRLTGFTFVAGTSTQNATAGTIKLVSTGNAPNMSMRVDHCHFDHIYQAIVIYTSGWVYGVADHNVFDCLQATLRTFQIEQPTYGGSTQVYGNGSWADYPWYGTSKFFFIEDNRINGSGTSVLTGNTDSINGGRYVVRHNYWKDAAPNSHGTEGGLGRGQRCWEVYDNTIEWTIAAPGAGQRSGTSLWHDNVYLGVEPGNRHHTNLPVFRQGPVRPNPIWGFSDGTSIWDQNDTEGNGTYVEAHAHTPYLFDSGTHTGANDSQGILVDSTKNWTTNQWVGYSIRNPNSTYYVFGSFIISNTSNTITYSYAVATDGRRAVFNTGDTYQIHRVLVTMDQNGRGKGDQITGVSQPINTVTGTAFWNHGALEPCMSWNNVHTPTGHALIYGGSSRLTVKEGHDYYNLGAGFPADTTPSQVSSIYTAARNGVDYTGTYVYPHPLVTAEPTPIPSATPSSQQHLQKKEAKKAKKLKRRKGGQKKIGE